MTVADSTVKYGCRVVFDVRLRDEEVVDQSPPTGVAHALRRRAEDTGLPHDDGCGNEQCQKCYSQYVRGQLECYECGSKFNFGSIRLVVIDTPTRGPVHDDNYSPWAKPYQQLLAPARIPDNCNYRLNPSSTDALPEWAERVKQDLGTSGQRQVKLRTPPSTNLLLEPCEQTLSRHSLPTLQLMLSYPGCLGIQVLRGR